MPSLCPLYDVSLCEPRDVNEFFTRSKFIVHFISTVLDQERQVITETLGRSHFTAVKKTLSKLRNEYLFTITGVKKMKWSLSLTRCHFQPRVTEGQEWLEMAPSEK